MKPVVQWVIPLVSARKQSGMSQGQVADRIGVSAATVSNLETGGRHVKFATIANYAALFDMEMKVIFVDRTLRVMPDPDAERNPYEPVNGNINI